MLLGQVCSLHDATPRTFVVHVIALYERGILDSNSIRFLFDLGLVPKGAYELSQITSPLNDGNSSSKDEIDGDECMFASASKMYENNNDDCTKRRSVETSSKTTCGMDEGAIVPYQENQPWRQYIPPPPLLPFPNTSKTRSSKANACEKKQQQQCSSSDNIQHSKKLAHRQKEASAIRKHLERHESLESSLHGSSAGIYASMNNTLSGGGLAAASSSSAASTSSTTNNSNFNHNGLNNNNNKMQRAYSSATQNTLTSADESFDNPSFRHNHHHQANEMSNHQHQQISKHISPPPSPAAASWSVDNHPLSLSRYQREFHQLSLLASGSFGSVYHAIHKLEQRPYAVKCVTFSTVGYYAETLSLVIREVRCLAQLNHPNCVRYYTSWLEPSWMTGDQKETLEDEVVDDDVGEFGGGVVPHASPKLLTDIERVIDGLHHTEEIDTSVEQLEAILYGNGEENKMDDGFNWSSSSPRKTSSKHSNEQKAPVDDWNNLPSYQSMSRYTDDGGDDDSDVSEWTQDLNNDSEERDSYHNSRAATAQHHKDYARQGSFELVPVTGRDGRNGGGGGNNVKNNHNQQYKRQTSSSSASVATYKYQISLYIQMQLCNPSTLADWIRHRNSACVEFNAEERQARARPAFEVFRQIVNGLAHVQ